MGPLCPHCGILEKAPGQMWGKPSFFHGLASFGHEKNADDGKRISRATMSSNFSLVQAILSTLFKCTVRFYPVVISIT